MDPVDAMNRNFDPHRIASDGETRAALARVMCFVERMHPTSAIAKANPAAWALYGTRTMVRLCYDVERRAGRAEPGDARKEKVRGEEVGDDLVHALALCVAYGLDPATLVAEALARLVTEIETTEGDAA